MLQLINKDEAVKMIEKLNTYRANVYQTPLKGPSVKQYVQNWNRLYTQLKGNWSNSLFNSNEDIPEDWIDHTDTVLELIFNMRDKRYPEKVISLPSQRNYLSALIQFGQMEGVMPGTIKIYTDARAHMNTTLTGTKHTANSAEQKQLLTTKEEVQEKVFDVLEKGGYVWSTGMPVIQYYMLMKFHSEHNMRNDCASLHWISQQTWRGISSEEKTSKNWLIGKSKGRGSYDWRIQLNDYKTKKSTDKPFEVNCSKSLNKLINHYLNNHWTKHYSSPAEQSTNHYSDFMMSPVFVKGKNDEIYLQKKIGTKMLRRSFYTENYGDIAASLTNDASNSLHSVGTAINHYTLSTEDEAAIQPLLELDQQSPIADDV